MLRRALRRILRRRGQFGLGGLGNCATPGSTPCCPGAGCACSVCVTGCNNAQLTNYTLLVTKSGGGTVYNSGPNDPVNANCARMTLLSGTNYDFNVTNSSPAYTPYDSGFIPAPCGGTLNVPMSLAGNPSVIFKVTGCCGNNVPNATVTMSGGSGGGSGTTDSGGNCTVQLPTGPNATYNYTITADRYNTATGTFNVLGCSPTAQGPVNATLSVASGYVCAYGYKPLKTTLNCTDSVYGGATLTYDAAATNPAYWGTGGGNWPAGCNCSTSSFSIYYLFNFSCTNINISACYETCDWWFCGASVLQRYCPHSPSGIVCDAAHASTNQFVNCTSLATLIANQGGGFGGALGAGWPVTGGYTASYTLDPFMLSVTFAPYTCSTGLTNDRTRAYMTGVTFTVTE